MEAVAEAQRKREEEAAKRVEEIKTRITSHEDFAKYGDKTWIGQYAEQAKQETADLDAIYADFEKKLQERKNSIIQAEQQRLTEGNQNKFTEYLKQVSETNNIDFDAIKAKFADLFNSITADTNTADTAIEKVKSYVEYFNQAKQVLSNGSDDILSRTSVAKIDAKNLLLKDDEITERIDRYEKYSVRLQNLYNAFAKFNTEEARTAASDAGLTDLPQKMEEIQNRMGIIKENIAALEEYRKAEEEAQRKREAEAEAQRKRDEEVAARAEQIKTRMSSHEDFEKYGDKTWLGQYAEQAKKEGADLDAIYADFEKKLQERKSAIIQAEQQKITEGNQNKFTEYLKQVSEANNIDFETIKAKFADLFNSITTDTNTADTAIEKVKAYIEYFNQAK